jgi:hypothetical protein
MGFLLGALSNKLNVFGSDKKNRKYYILSNVVLTVSLGIFTATALNLFFNMIDPGRNYFFVSEWVDKVAYYVSMLLSMLSFLHISVYVFRFSFNKTSRLASELAKNSYAVYIIHLVVIGLIALPLLNIAVPAFIKFLILTILAFAVSNLIVSAYRIFFQRAFSSNILRMSIPVAAIFLSLAIYASQRKPSVEDANPPVSQTDVSAPALGLHMAVIQGNIEVVKQHIAAGTDPDQKEPSGGSSPLITAALFGKTDIALALIEAGSDVNFKNNEGSTPLHTAAFFCHVEIVDALLDHGADTSLTNNAGTTAFESVAVPFHDVKGIYDYFVTALGPLGLELDYEQIKTTRPIIAEMLQ